MTNLTVFEERVSNNGERLIPGVTLGLAELIRHRSSYMFFRKVIEFDLRKSNYSSPCRIIDLGCGVGHGCETLANIPNSQVVGIDSSPEAIAYAKRHYTRPNINYLIGSLREYIPTMPEFDYVVSRNVLEHIPNGLHLAFNTRWRYRLLFDVPYNEPPGRNPHHILFDIREDTFIDFEGAELFFQDLQGIIYDQPHKPPQPNVIACICSSPACLPIIKSDIRFPLAAWQPRCTIGQKIINKLKYITKR